MLKYKNHGPFMLKKIGKVWRGQMQGALDTESLLKKLQVWLQFYLNNTQSISKLLVCKVENTLLVLSN